MSLRGSCHCGAVRFQLRSAHPYPYNLCYCSICRKTAGGGGYAINLSGDFQSLEVQGRGQIRIYRAKLHNDAGESKQSPAQRNFCGLCGSALWLWDPRWPELVHPFASAIDSDLPTPPERTHMMLGSKPSWVAPCAATGDRQFREYSDESIADWHERLGLTDDEA